MPIADFLTSKQQAMMLGRTPAEQLDLLQYSLKQDEAEKAELIEREATLHNAGYGTKDFQQRIRALERSCRQQRTAIAAVKTQVN